ncbi:MAG: amino acid carrier protein, partial [Calditrichaeota bacterium]
IVVNTLTTLTIILTGLWKLTPAAGVALGAGAHIPAHASAMAQQLGINLSGGGLTSTALTTEAFNSVIPFGGSIIALGSLLFGYTTLIGWAYYGEICLEYLFGVHAKKPYRYAYITLLFIGAILTGKYLNIVWYVGDTFNAIMALPNLVGLLFLAKIVSKITSEFYKTNKLQM